MHLSGLVDRDVFAGYKTLILKVKSDLVWSIGTSIVVKRPAAALAVNETAVLILLIRPQSRDPACLAMLSPEYWINPVAPIERRDDGIGDASVALGGDHVRVQAQCESAGIAREGMYSKIGFGCALCMSVSRLVCVPTANATAKLCLLCCDCLRDLGF